MKAPLIQVDRMRYNGDETKNAGGTPSYRHSNGGKLLKNQLTGSFERINWIKLGNMRNSCIICSRLSDRTFDY